MRKPTRQLWIAIVIGSAISAVLFKLDYATHSAALYAPQFIGFYVCMLLRGVHTATETDYALIAIPVNAITYTTVVLILLRIIWRAKSS
jgi:hypothetical protein